MTKSEPGRIFDFDSAARALDARFGDRFTTASGVRAHHAQDEGWHAPAAPDGVLFAASTADVADAMRICAEHGVPVIPYGAGSAMEGSINAVQGGLTIDLSAMNAILSVNALDMDCTVQAGCTRSILNAHLRDTGLTFPVDPGADATLGGMAATRASGTMTVRYGSMRDNVIGLEVVLADGSIVTTGGRARKSSSGYDLTRLFVGAEGTLGIITALTLRLHPVPEHVLALRAVFEESAAAIDFVVLLMQLGYPVARAEFMDELALEAARRYEKRNHPLRPTIFLELHATGVPLDDTRTAVLDCLKDCGAQAVDLAESAEQRSAIWKTRHNAAHAEPLLRPGTRAMVTDVCVPLSNLAACIVETQQDLQATGLCAPIVGHLGDGNFHLAILIDPDSVEEIQAAKELHARLVERALGHGGTISGEHGIGLGKRQFLRAEHGTGLDLMQRIKQSLDPKNILNPGKIFPQTGESGSLAGSPSAD